MKNRKAESGKRKARNILRAACCVLLLAVSVRADLVVTVTPGYQFSVNEMPTTMTLNLLGTPTVQVSGTLGGTNIAIGAGSITGTMLSGTVVDGVTVDFNGSNPRAIEVMAQGIHTNNLDTNDFQMPLSDYGQKVQLLYDRSTLQTNTSSQLSVNQTNLAFGVWLQPTNIIGRSNTLIGAQADNLDTNLNLGTNFGIGAGLLTNVLFTSTNAVLPGQNSFTLAIPHGLQSQAGGAPTQVRWVLVNVSPDQGYSPPQEVDVLNTADSGSGGPHCGIGCDTTNAFIVVRNVNNWQVFNYSSQAVAAITTANWRLKCYVRP